ncbi:hypothetical protein DFP72DRAFT_808144, partial [Ephemerocybe angulata]
FGTMYAIGWHSSMELGKTLVCYATGKARVAQEKLRKLLPCLSDVAQLYREGLCSLFPRGYKDMSDVAASNGIAEWSDVTFDGSELNNPFGNALVVTHNDFCNFLHKDRDEIEVAYGMWWAGMFDTSLDTWRFDDKVDHGDIEGGEFLYGEYGIVVDFERYTLSLPFPHIIDAHSIHRSTTPEGLARFGTSIQITAMGAAAFRRFWNMDAGERRSVLTNMSDRQVRAGA